MLKINQKSNIFSNNIQYSKIIEIIINNLYFNASYLHHKLKNIRIVRILYKKILYKKNYILVISKKFEKCYSFQL